MRIIVALLLLSLALLGCKEKEPPFSGTFVNSANGAKLVIADKKFTLTIGQETIEGETSELSGKLFLHPKTLDGKTEDEATSQAFNDSAKLGKQTDMMRLGSIYENTELTISEDKNTLTPEQKPPMRGGGSSFWNTVGPFVRQ